MVFQNNIKIVLADFRKLNADYRRNHINKFLDINFFIKKNNLFCENLR
jgi:hypothetical protein